MENNIIYYGELRVRNSGAGRVKPIRFRNKNDNNSWGVNDILRSAKYNILDYLKEYKINSYDRVLLVKPGVYKGWGQIYIQGSVKDTDKYLPDSFFKTQEELEDYLMKYYFAYRVEYDIYYWMKWHKEHPRANRDALYDTLFDENLQRYHVLYKAGVIDFMGEFQKYYETGKSDLPKVLYENYLKYKENPNWIQDKIIQSKDAQSNEAIFGMLNFVNSFGGPFLRNGFNNMMNGD